MRYTAEHCEKQAAIWQQMAQAIREAKQLQQGQGLPIMDEGQAVEAVKKVYCDLQSVPKVAQWAFDSKLPGFTASRTQAQERINGILDAKESNGPLDDACKMLRERNKEKARRIW